MPEPKISERYQTSCPDRFSRSPTLTDLGRSLDRQTRSEATPIVLKTIPIVLKTIPHCSQDNTLLFSRQ